MYGQVLGVSTVTTGAAGVALLPNTGNTRVLFIAAAAMLAIGTVTFVGSTVASIKQRKANKA
jgi:uncharacterized membrane protein YgdD (TMEM256/DUF423 family)